MIIYFLVVIPVIAILVLLFFYRKNTTWWEYLMLFGVAVLIIAAMKVIGEKSQSNDTEYWGDLIKKAKYYEAYSIWDDETCTRSVACGKDDKGNTKYCDEKYDCSHLDSHPAHWEITTILGWEMSISKEFYEYLVKKFGVNVQFKDMNRRSECGLGDYVVKDGNMYFVEWDGNSAKSEAVVKTHTYENKVQCSRSIFNYRDIDEDEAKKAGLYSYPKISDHRAPNILGGQGCAANLDSAEQRLGYLNGNLGPKKQLRVQVLIFKDKPLSIAKLQEAYWKNGNKNEFVVTIGLDKQNKATWCYVFSWTEIAELKISTRDYVMSQEKFNPLALADYLSKELEAKWVRKQFKDFSYLTVEPPLWALILAFVLEIAFCVAYGFWAVNNEHNPKEETN